MNEPRPLVLASHRGPVGFRRSPEGRLEATAGSGGLAAGLAPLAGDLPWVAVAMSEADRAAARSGTTHEQAPGLELVEIPEESHRLAYDGLANSVLWFCYHGLWDRTRQPRFDRAARRAWNAYAELNEAVARRLVGTAPSRALILVQDYQLALVPGLVAHQRPDVALVHFSHTPFPGPDDLSVLPDLMAVGLLEGMTAAHACGFHTRRWAERFTACCEELLGRSPATFVSPLPSDPDSLLRRAAGDQVAARRAELDAQVGDRTVIARVDRIEPTKNIVRGIDAVDLLLNEHPEWSERLVMVAALHASRPGVADNRAYDDEVSAAAERVNEAHRRPGWEPILIVRGDDPDRSLALYQRADVMLVNPIVDGLNLVAREAMIVGRRDPVLVLSRQAGVVDELGPEALVINPYDLVATAQALRRALTMEPRERQRRAAGLRARAQARRPSDWIDDQREAARP